MVVEGRSGGGLPEVGLAALEAFIAGGKDARSTLELSVDEYDVAMMRRSIGMLIAVRLPIIWDGREISLYPLLQALLAVQRQSRGSLALDRAEGVLWFTRICPAEALIRDVVAALENQLNCVEAMLACGDFKHLQSLGNRASRHPGDGLMESMLRARI